MRAFLVALILIASGASAAAPGEPQLAAYLEEHGKSPEDYVISKFADHQIVFLGEYHRIRHDVELVQRLMPLLYKAGIHNLGIEFGAEELQAEADRLVTADVYDPLLARSLMFRWEPWWGYHEYIELYHAAWDVNRSRPKGAAPFRIGITHGGQKGLILLDQMRAVDKNRLTKKLGAVSAKTLTSTLTTLQEVFTE